MLFPLVHWFDRFTPRRVSHTASTVAVYVLAPYRPRIVEFLHAQVDAGAALATMVAYGVCFTLLGVP